MAGYTTGEALLQLWQHDPVAFLEQHVFTHHRAKPSAVGFKLFYYHAHDELWQPVWTYLVERRDIRILHMKRANILHTVLSRKRAEVTDTWVNLDGKPGRAPRVVLDYEECLQAFTQTRQWEQEYARMFSAHPLLDVIYEELVENRQQVMNQVQSFLGLKLRNLSPNTHKQAQDLLAEAITNYAELKTRFADSPWAEFFVE
jgi:LPS sulfotransferase NodH